MALTMAWGCFAMIRAQNQLPVSDLLTFCHRMEFIDTLPTWEAPSRKSDYKMECEHGHVR